MRLLISILNTHSQIVLPLYNNVFHCVESFHSSAGLDDVIGIHKYKKKVTYIYIGRPIQSAILHKTNIESICIFEKKYTCDITLQPITYFFLPLDCLCITVLPDGLLTEILFVLQHVATPRWLLRIGIQVKEGSIYSHH